MLVMHWAVSAEAKDAIGTLVGRDIELPQTLVHTCEVHHLDNGGRVDLYGEVHHLGNGGSVDLYGAWRGSAHNEQWTWYVYSCGDE